MKREGRERAVVLSAYLTLPLIPDPSLQTHTRISRKPALSTARRRRRSRSTRRRCSRRSRTSRYALIAGSGAWPLSPPPSGRSRTHITSPSPHSYHAPPQAIEETISQAEKAVLEHKILVAQQHMALNDRMQECQDRAKSVANSACE